ncbi:TPA: hypothetical protein ACFU2V_001370, partial [Neisseria subflava]
EQWHGATPHKAFSDLKYGTEHGTMAQSMAQTPSHKPQNANGKLAERVLILILHTTYKIVKQLPHRDTSNLPI